ncbi:hypothetical protein FEM48_Zijuj01G0163600 [Ziziphus jujuba var. spinosa]|uniref:Uncharacterized protein n=1 Tax=Ziziphus jujuba var. spinosa TaxID=714518 RepID=A0A978W2A4_ZIZJJ|nr:hypothetical protein FEM48_Zijuj01G0163600 [Ziziphus jujuba var. spinosa]
MGETDGMDGVGVADGWGGANGAGVDGGDEIDKLESHKAMSRRRAINRAIYDPSHSSTYTSIQCDDQRCIDISANVECSPTGKCFYNKTNYARGSMSSGLIDTEQLTFRPIHEGIAEEITVVSGMILYHIGLWIKIFLCIGDITDNDYGYNLLILGNNNTYINPNGMWSKSAVTDTGTSGRWLVSGLYTELRIKIVAFTEDLGLNSTTDESRKLCYHGNFTTEPVNSQLTNVHTIASLHFANGADLDLDAKSLFYITNKGKFCVDVNPSITEEVTIIGLRA